MICQTFFNDKQPYLFHKLVVTYLRLKTTFAVEAKHFIYSSSIKYVYQMSYLPKVELVGMSGGEIVQDNVEIRRQEAMRLLEKK